MWNWFNCYLSGRHQFTVTCEPGAVFLRCAYCGRRSPGWTVSQSGQKTAQAQPIARGPSVASSSRPARAKQPPAAFKGIAAGH